MNKLKIKIKKRLTDELARVKSFSSDFYKGEQEGINFALYAIDSIDEPEKPVLSKDEAEWVDKLTECYVLSDALYYITRCGYGFGFRFKIQDKTYKLADFDELTYFEIRGLKKRLINAVLYGYEVEKEKLYTVEIPNPNGGTYLALCKDVDGKLFFDTFFSEEWKTFGKCKLTESEIKEDFDWAWQFAEEVEE